MPLSRNISRKRAFEMLPNTAPFDVTGHPACTLPAGLADGLPVGVMVIGKRFAEAANTFGISAASGGKQ